MAFEEDDESPAVDLDSASDGDRNKDGGLDDFGAPDGGGAIEAYAQKEQPAQTEPEQAGPSLVQRILNFGRQLTGIGGSDPHQDEINQAQDTTKDFIGKQLESADPWAGPQGGEDMFAGVPESENIEDRRDQKYESPASKLMKIGGSGRSFAAGGLVEEEEPEAPATDLEEPDVTGSVDAPQQEAAPQEAQQPGLMDRISGGLGKLKEAAKTMPRMGSPPPPDQQPGIVPRIQSGMQSFMRYLSGADAAPSEHVLQLERQVDPQGALDDDTRKIQTLEAAHREGGEQGAWSVLQHYRQKYDRYRGFAAAALKAGNLPSATKAATQAYSNLMDGNTVLFTPAADGGVLASISRPRSRAINSLSKTMDVSSTVNLSPQQFQEWLTGMPGQFDNALENGAPKVLQQLVQQGQQAPAASPPQSVTGNPSTGPGTSAVQPPPMSGRTNRVAEMGTPPEVREPGQLPAQEGDSRPFAAKGVGKPGQYRELPSNYRSPKTAEEEFPDDPQAAAMAERMHPGDKQAQAHSVYAQGQQKEKNKIDMAKAQHQYTVDAAKVRAAGEVEKTGIRSQGTIERAKEVNKGKIAIELSRAANATQNAHEKNLYKMIGDVVKVMPFGVDGDKASQFIDAELKKRGIDPRAARQVPALQDIYEGEATPAAPAAPAQAQQKFTPPKGQGWQYNPNLKQYRDRQGNMYDANGKRVQ